MKSNVSILSGKILLFSFKKREFKNYEIALEFIVSELMKLQTKSQNILFLVSLCRSLCEDEHEGPQFTKCLEFRMKKLFMNLDKF